MNSGMVTFNFYAVLQSSQETSDKIQFSHSLDFLFIYSLDTYILLMQSKFSNERAYILMFA